MDCNTSSLIVSFFSDSISSKPESSLFSDFLACFSISPILLSFHSFFPSCFSFSSQRQKGVFFLTIFSAFFFSFFHHFQPNTQRNEGPRQSCTSRESKIPNSKSPQRRQEETKDWVSFSFSFYYFYLFFIYFFNLGVCFAVCEGELEKERKFTNYRIRYCRGIKRNRRKRIQTTLIWDKTNLYIWERKKTLASIFHFVHSLFHTPKIGTTIGGVDLLITRIRLDFIREKKKN